MNSQARTGIFVLNLDRSPDRMGWIAAQLAALAMPYHRIAAIDGECDDLDAVMRSLGVRLGRPKKRPLGRGEIACYLTHLTTFRLAIARGCAAALILEDDVEILTDITPVLHEFAQFEDEPYILKLDPWHKAHWQIPVAKFANIDAVYTPDPLWYAAAYCISRAAMKRAVVNLTEIQSPIDKDLFSYPRAGLTVLMSSPPLVVQARERFESLLQTERQALSAKRSRQWTWMQQLRRRYIRPLRRRYKSVTGLVRPFWRTSRQFGVSSVLSLRLRRPSASQSPCMERGSARSGPPRAGYR